jgi:hypothetical protein
MEDQLVSLAIDALNEGHRIILSRQIPLIRRLGVQVDLDSSPDSDSFEKARRSFRTIITKLRFLHYAAFAELPESTFDFEPWTLGFINGPLGKPYKINLGTEWETIERAIEHINNRRDFQTSNEYRMEILEPIQKHHEGWTEFLRRLRPTLPSEFLSKPITKKKAVTLLGRIGNENRSVEWLNKCIAEGTIWYQEMSRQSGRYDIRQFPKDAHKYLRSQ